MEVAGLVLGVIGVSGLFSACIESFDIVVSAKHFSDDYEQLCALISCLFSDILTSRTTDRRPGSSEAAVARRKENRPFLYPKLEVKIRWHTH